MNNAGALTLWAPFCVLLGFHVLLVCAARFSEDVYAELDLAEESALSLTVEVGGYANATRGVCVCVCSYGCVSVVYIHHSMPVPLCRPPCESTGKHGAAQVPR